MDLWINDRERAIKDVTELAVVLRIRSGLGSTSIVINEHEDGSVFVTTYSPSTQRVG